MQQWRYSASVTATGRALGAHASDVFSLSSIRGNLAASALRGVARRMGAELAHAASNKEQA
jgi:hypothetical protein